MSELGYHVILRLADDRVIAPSRAERRRWATELARLTRVFPIVAWKLADTHLHVVIRGDAAEFVRRLRIWAARSLGARLEVQRRKPLVDQSHLAAAFAYALRQDDHHGIETDAFQDASAVVDILGLRALSPELPARVREHLPRLARDTLLRHLGVDALAEEVHADHLGEAAAAAFGLERLGNDATSRRARRAAVAAATDLGPSAIARALGITPQSVCRIARRAGPATREVRAVKLQMALRAARPERPAFVAEACAAAYVA